MTFVIPLLTFLVIGVTYIAKRSIPAHGNVLAVLGSGGHTGELLTMLQTTQFVPDFVFGSGDPLSIEKARQAGYGTSQFYELPRARRVGESKMSSVFSVLKCLFAALRLMWKLKPHTVICNGPATCVVVVVALRILGLSTEVIYIESLARVRSLSLSGYILNQLDWADKFLVQWPELAQKYPGTEYKGILV